MMIAIIAHHYVVNSGISNLYDFNNITGNMIFLQIFGFAGKAMINGFLLISGYFMIKYHIILKKIIKLYLQMSFINVLCQKLSKKQYIIFLRIIFFYYTVIPTFFIFNDTFGELAWHIFVYLIGGYIRLYKDKFEKAITV